MRENLEFPLPSWVPSWKPTLQEACETQHTGYPGGAKGDPLIPGYIGGAKDSVDLDQQQLSILGLYIGPIQEMTQIFQEGRDDIFSTWVRMADRVMPAKHTPVAELTGRDRTEFYTLITQGLPPSRAFEVEEKVDYMASHNYRGVQAIHPYQVTLTTIIASCKSRRLAKVGTDRLALVPECAQLGDRIYVFPGLYVPLILRRTGNAYRLVGETHAQGMTPGEALEDVRISTMETVTMA